MTSARTGHHYLALHVDIGNEVIGAIKCNSSSHGASGKTSLLIPLAVSRNAHAVSYSKLILITGRER
jgi:hypothetical protein